MVRGEGGWRGKDGWAGLGKGRNRKQGSFGDPSSYGWRERRKGWKLLRG